MLSASVTRWAAWAPGLEDRARWEAWAGSPRALPADGMPDVRFLPPLLRRRCSRLSRMMLKVAFECCAGEEVGTVPTVFASRYGDMTETVALLERLARREPLTAARFSHSVHNAPAGLFAIAARNRHGSASVAGGRDTFACAFLEALAALQQGAGPRVLLVAADEPLPPILQPFRDEPEAPFGLGLLLARNTDGPGLRLDLASGPAARTSRAWPATAEFLRWLLSKEPALTLGADGRRWTWSRPSGA